MRLNDQKNKVLFLTMEHQYRKDINYKNIETLSRFSIYKILKQETKKDKEIFLHWTLDKWIVNSNLEDDKLFKVLNKLIKKLKINLTDIEEEALFVLEERAFSIYRHIKDIEVNFNLYKKEKVGVKFTDAKLFGEDKKLTLIVKADLLITNKRIIIADKEVIESFPFSQLVEYQFKDYGFAFKMKNDLRYIIRIHDQKTLKNTVTNILEKKVKNATKKRKDN